MVHGLDTWYFVNCEGIVCTYRSFQALSSSEESGQKYAKSPVDEAYHPMIMHVSGEKRSNHTTRLKYDKAVYVCNGS